MKHVKALTQKPLAAQSSVCSNIAGDFQAQLCFLLEFLTTFLLPFLDTKDPNTSGNGTA